MKGKSVRVVDERRRQRVLGRVVVPVDPRLSGVA